MWPFVKQLLGFETSAATSYDPIEPTEADLRTKRIRQLMEFTLSPTQVEPDSDLRHRVCTGTDGYCDIEYFLTLNRLKTLDATVPEILAACRTSTDLEVSDDGTRVRTRVPFAPDARRPFRSIRVEGITEGKTIEKLRPFFRQTFGRVLHIEIVGGSVIVELESEELARLAADRGIEYQNQKTKVTLLAEVRAASPERRGTSPSRRTCK
jgi:hypothetical protein